MRFAGVAIMVGIIMWGLPAAADFYRYLDAGGRICYTDDITKIPPGQRNKMRTYSAVSVAPKASEKSPVGPEKKAGTTSAVREVETGPDNKAPAELKRLQQQQTALDQEYRDLLKAKQELEQSGKNLESKAAVIRHGQAVARLNEAIAAYENKRNAFNAAIEAYNRSIK